LFQQFKENLSLAGEFTGTVRGGLRSAQEAWRKATPDKRAVWLLVPAVIVVSAVAEHFSARFRAVGTIPEWMQVLEFGGIFGLAMLLLDAIRDRDGVAKWPNLFATAISAFLFGMLEVFGWSVLHGGIALLFWVVLLAAFGVGFVIRRGRKRTEIASKMR
jgi:hypothetical protein